MGKPLAMLTLYVISLLCSVVVLQGLKAELSHSDSIAHHALFTIRRVIQTIDLGISLKSNRKEMPQRYARRSVAVATYVCLLPATFQRSHLRLRLMTNTNYVWLINLVFSYWLSAYYRAHCFGNSRMFSSLSLHYSVPVRRISQRQLGGAT